MKDQYIGDSKDYGKYRILTMFVNTTDLKLGVNWYRTPDDDSSQGRTRLKHCTDPLYKQMIQFGATKRLSLEDIENSGLLPNGTEYFNSELYYRPELDNMIARQVWHGHALSTTKNADVVFLDPDNGLPPKNILVPINRRIKSLRVMATNMFDLKKFKRTGTEGRV